MTAQRGYNEEDILISESGIEIKNLGDQGLGIDGLQTACRVSAYIAALDPFPIVFV